jgi:Cellulase M and related proteins
MEIKVDRDLLVNLCKELIQVPSPVSYYEEIHPFLEEKAKELGYEVTYDRKRTAYITLEGEDNSKTVCMGAHVDTIGLIVRHIRDDGQIEVRQLGGVNYSSLEGESVTVHTRDGRAYRGMVICKSHSVHVYDDARTLPRDEANMRVILHEDVHTQKDVMDLGIEHGDVISVDPHFEYTESGFVKSRFIDDKACVAVLLAMVDYLNKNHLKPKYRTLLAFPLYEEIGHGGSYVPEEVSEYVALDIGLIGPDCHATEKHVSICAKDAFSPYDRGLTNRIINQAKKADVNYCVDIFYRYGTDANAAIRGGHNVYTAAFGMACINTHGMERCHVEAIEETAKLAIAYALDIE